MNSTHTSAWKMIGCLAGLALLLSVASAPAASAQQRVRESKPAAATGTVDIYNLAGSVKVTGWNRSEVAIEGTLGEGTKNLEFEVTGNETVIRVEIYDERERRERGIRRVEGSNLEIRIPHGSRLEANTVSADIWSDTVDGALRLETVSGTVEIGGEPERIGAKTISGDIEIRGSGGPVRAESVSGHIIIREVTGEVEANTISGDIRITGRSIEEAYLSALSGTVIFEGDLSPQAVVEVEIHSGSVTLILPADVSADFDITTFSGRIENEFGQQSERRSRYMPGRILSFQTGNAEARVRIKAFSGDVTLEKR